MSEITLCMIVHNDWKGTKKAIESAESICSKIAIVDQGSNSRNTKHLKKMADWYIRRTCKGYADPDRQGLYNLVPPGWILALDSDEYLSKELKAKILEMVEWPYDVFWFRFINLVDGKDIKVLLGDDFHPRLFKKGTVVWPARAHTFPEIRSPKQYFCNLPIIHNRTLRAIEATHKNRKRVLDQQNVTLEVQFIDKLKQLLEGPK